MVTSYAVSPWTLLSCAGIQVGISVIEDVALQHTWPESRYNYKVEKCTAALISIVNADYRGDRKDFFSYVKRLL